MMERAAPATPRQGPQRSPRFHRVLLALAGLAWLTGTGGNLYASLFLGDARVHRLDIMSPQTAWQIISLWGGWWIAVVTLMLCLVTRAFTRQSRALTLALGASAVYAFPLALLALGVL